MRHAPDAAKCKDTKSERHHGTGQKEDFNNLIYRTDVLVKKYFGSIIHWQLTEICVMKNLNSAVSFIIINNHTDVYFACTLRNHLNVDSFISKSIKAACKNCT